MKGDKSRFKLKPSALTIQNDIRTNNVLYKNLQLYESLNIISFLFNLKK